MPSIRFPKLDNDNEVIQLNQINPFIHIQLPGGITRHSPETRARSKNPFIATPSPPNLTFSYENVPKSKNEAFKESVKSKKKHTNQIFISNICNLLIYIIYRTIFIIHLS